MGVEIELFYNLTQLDWAIGGDWFRPDTCDGGSMSRTLDWPGKSFEQITTANSDVAGRVGFAAPVRMAA